MTTKIKQQTRKCTQSSQCPECGNEMNMIKEGTYRCPKCKTQVEKKT